MLEHPDSPPATSSRVRRFRVLAVGIPVVIGLLFSWYVLQRRGVVSVNEGRLTFSRPPLYLQEPGFEITGHRYLYDKTLGWRNIPGWQATTRGRPLTINDQGLRDGPHAYEKPAGVRRILVLGDSYAWGYGVADDETFSHVLEADLKSQPGSWEVINAGVSGWGTDQEYLYLLEHGFDYDPDIVVLAFFLANDIDNNLAATQYELHKPVFTDYELTLANVPVPRPGWQVAPQISRKLSLLDGPRLTAAILRRMGSVCADRKCEFVTMKFGLFLAPQLPYAVNLEAALVQAIDHAEVDTHFFDLDLAFRDENIETVALLEGNDDGHWNEVGHRQTARLLQQFLRDHHLLDGGGAG